MTAQQRRKSNLAHFRRFAVAVAISGAVASGFAQGQSPESAPRPRQMPGGAIVPQPPSAAPNDSAPDAGLSPELMYRLLLGDVALQRGEPALAARAYLEAARETRDPTLARRATEIAVGARARSLSIESARLWSEIDPSAQRPKQLIAALASGGGTKGFDSPGVGNDLKAELERVLADAASSPAALGEAFLQLNRLLAYEPDKQATLRLVESVAQPYPDLAEARFAVALAALNTGLNELSTSSTALREIDRALILKPGWERAAMLKGEILSKRSPEEAIAYLIDYMKAHPDSKAAAGSLAELYVAQKRYAEARAIFERFWAADKTNRDYEFAIAALAVQMKDWGSAEKLFEDLKQANYDENGGVELYLAQIADETGRYALAFDRYRAVPDGERAWIAKLRAATMLAKQNRIAEARRYLADLPAVTIEQRVEVRQAEAQLLRDAGDNAAAYAVLAQALVEQPDQPGLLYDIAMVAEKLDKIDVVEARLTQLIALNPENAQALNALGYTLVDRTKRTAEGAALIERAHKLDPKDPFILDSMGWAQFRLGDLDAAEGFLRRALVERPDAEIAAHLGEVLWAKGEQARAREVWQSQLKSTPDNPVLLETMRRHAP
jgi:tetratricopeptide (TPR) repeat protein